MSKHTRRRLLSVLVLILACLACLEAALRVVDPLGVYRYFADYTALTALSLPSPDGFRYTPGTHHFAMSTVTIGLDGLRVVQGAHDTPCRIAFVGDSVTFGMGSDVSFVDLLAPDLDATVINAGLPGYSAANVQAELSTIPAEGYVWLVIQNDDEPFFHWPHGAGALPSATSLYLGRIFLDGGGSLDTARFQANAAGLLGRDDVLVFAFDGARLTDIAVQQSPRVHVIPMYTHHVSPFDAHPSPEGAHQIAEVMRDAVTAFAAQQCDRAHDPDTQS